MKEKKEKLTKEQRIEEYNKKIINYNRVVSLELANRNKIKKATPNSYICIQNVNKIYDNYVQAVYDFSLDVYKNEFIVLVGPSGCGKSTTLRMIAGLEEITAGNLFIDQKYANTLAPKERDIAIVFQSYALYPHMNVYDNMAFSLRIKPFNMPLLGEDGKQVVGIDQNKVFESEFKYRTIEDMYKCVKKYNFNGTTYKEIVSKIENDLESASKQVQYYKTIQIPLYKERKMSKQEIANQVTKSAKILQIEDLLYRKPKALSGGQRQRVALGRAIVKNAKLFLMDEPLSNLDAKLRVSMRSEIKKLHKTIGATTIYVTHDQTEAMTMADRIVVMNKGKIQQIGTPKDIYNNPANIFVATFIGSPAMNITNVKLSNNKIDLGEGNILEIDDNTQQLIKNYYLIKLDEVNKEIENGLENEYKKELMVKKETITLQITKGKYKASYDNNGKIIDPLENLTLNESEKEICRSLYESKLKTLKEYQEKYNTMLENNEYSLILGIRPEDVYLEDSIVDPKMKKTNLFNVTISLSELLGNEYYLHTKFNNTPIILKANANFEIKENCINKIFADESKLKFFDPVSSNLIK